MKIRNGFVSNSSSSSFILASKEDVEFFRSRGIKVFYVKELIQTLKNFSSSLPYFMAQGFWVHDEAKRLEQLAEKYGGEYLAITEEVDRDEEFHRDRGFPVYKGDL